MKHVTLEHGPLSNNEMYCDLVFDEYGTGRQTEALGRRRRIVAPATEEQALVEVLARPEYPLPTKLVELCHGLPVLDIGAHVGSAAVYFDELLSPSRLTCYEPNPVAHEYLQRNLPYAVLHQAAVSNASGMGEFFVRVPMFTSGSFENGQPREACQVPVVSGIDAIDGVPGEIGVLKIDAEASELPILYSLRTELHRVRVVFIEYHNEDARRLIDSLLRDFMLFHARTCEPALSWGQGTVGYCRRQLLEESDAKELACSQGL